MVELLLVASLGAVVAVAVRTLWAFHNVKEREAKESGATVRFDKKYALTAIGALIAAVPTAQEALAAVQATTGFEGGVLTAFWAGFAAGGGWNWILNAFADKGA